MHLGGNYMAFRGTRPAIRAYAVFTSTVKTVEVVEKDNKSYYRVNTNHGVVNLGLGGVNALKQRYDFDDIMDIVGQELDFTYKPNPDPTYSDFQLAFVLGPRVEGVVAKQTATQTPSTGTEEFF